MDNFANEVDKLLQDTRREQEENEEGGSHGIRSDRSAKKQGYNTQIKENRTMSDQILATPDHDEAPEVPDTRQRGFRGREFKGRFVDSARTKQSNSPSLSITIHNSRGGRNESRRYPRSDSRRARGRGPHFNQLNNSSAAAWSGGKSFDYGHGSLNPLHNTGPSTSGFNQLNDYWPGREAARHAEAAATAQLLKVDISIRAFSFLQLLCRITQPS